MGLSASQARFLAVTSRKSSCEFRSMELAQQKLSLTRELQNATEEYHDALNATKLVWDADTIYYPGEFRYDLSYDLLMTPSDVNKYMPYLVTRQDGKIALQGNMAKAACGITKNGNEKIFNYVINDDGTYSSDGGLWYQDPTTGKYKVVYKGDADYDVAREENFTKFIEAMRDNKAMPGVTANTILNLQPEYQLMKDAGVGGEIVGKETANVMDMTNLLSYIDYIVANSQSGYFVTDSDEYKLAQKLIFDFNFVSGSNKATLNHSWSNKFGSTELYLNGEDWTSTEFITQKTDDGVKTSTEKTSQIFTLSDLLNEDVTLLVTGKQKFSRVFQIIDQAISNVNDFKNWDLLNEDVETWYNKMMKDVQTSNNNSSNNDYDYETLVQRAADNTEDEAKSELALLNFFDKLAKSMYALFMPNANDDTALIPKEAQNAYLLALSNTLTRMRNIEEYGEKSSFFNTILGLSQGSAKSAVNNADYYNSWYQEGNYFALSLSNLTEAFMTDFIDGLEQNANNCLITKNVNTSSYITDDAGHLYTVNLVNEEDTTLWEQEFYSIIFNNMCTQGFYQNDLLDENKYLENALKNGNLFISSKSADNYYYQTRYNEVYENHISTEADQAAITVAERNYSYIKSKLNMKEEQIEIEQKSVESELAALTAEVNTIQTLIKNNINSSFKLFSSGS